MGPFLTGKGCTLANRLWTKSRESKHGEEGQPQVPHNGTEEPYRAELGILTGVY